MFCTACGYQVSSGDIHCKSCGTRLNAPAEQSLSTGDRPSTAYGIPQSGSRNGTMFRLILVVIAVVATGIVLNLIVAVVPKHDSSSDSRDGIRPVLPPPKFRVFRQEDGRPVPIVVSQNATDEQLRSLLWFFREAVRARHFSQLGLKKPTGPGNTGFAAGIFDVFRGPKYANEPFTQREGQSTHVAALYSWGLDRDPDHDEAYIEGNGESSTKVFDYSDNWQLPRDEQQRVDEKKKADVRCTTEDPMAIMPVEGVLDAWKRGSSSKQYWVGGIEKQKLFAVTNHESLDRYYIPDKHSVDGQRPNSAAFKFRIESSTQGGLPITKDWYIDVTLKDGECKVYELQEAE